MIPSDRLKDPLDLPVRRVLKEEDKKFINRLRDVYEDILGFWPNTAILEPDPSREITLVIPGQSFCHAVFRKRDQSWVIYQIASFTHSLGSGSLLLRQFVPPIEAKTLRESRYANWWERRGFTLVRVDLTSVRKDLLVWKRDQPWP